MKIESSELQLQASHHLVRDTRYATETAFSFGSALRAADAALPAAAARSERMPEIDDVRRVLQELVAAILAVLRGENCRCRTENIATEAPAGLRGGWRVEWRRRTTEEIDERERTEVSASGVVRTADGRSIDFQLGMTMCREFSCKREAIEEGSVEFRDPLVINFDGKPAGLTTERFAFDLDADGRTELLPRLAAGSGYVCFDSDGDGRIANGRELFGATGACTGDGFADLARLDGDSNGWIDEADPAFAALGVWFPDGRITPLKEAGVGAMNLASAWSPFALRDGENRPLGQVWRSGVFLHEDGRVGSLQQIDLATPVNEPAEAAPRAEA
ncbi:MAG: hypothetical protein L6Q60_02165 [Rhodocyclaceae bacterium]|nr:hypothetical protein [Rhodocyclaceae bacterium]